MNILTPISCAEDIIPLAKEGANEFFTGYINREWIEVFNDLRDENGNMQLTLNRRNGLRANITDFQEMKEVVQLTREVGGRLYVTVNAPFYTQNMYHFLHRYFRELLDAGVERLIVSDIGVMELLSSEFPEFKITVSCLAQVVNSSMVEFYRQFGVERIVFPRHISLRRVTEIAQQFPELEFECFGLCEKCLHDDGNCRCMHNVGAFCMECWNSVFEATDGKELPAQIKHELMLNEALYKNWISPATLDQETEHNFGCSLCAVGSLLQHPNITTLKLSGRGKGLDFVIAQVLMTKNVVSLFRNGSSVQEIRENVQQAMGNHYCRDHFHCIMRGE